jgi:peptide/nickel transport system ATP-binding protein
VTAAPLLEVADLHVTFPGGVRAVRGLGYAVEPGEVLGIVGESGAGKSAAALAVMGLLPPGAEVTGSVRLCGRELRGLPDRELSAIRGRRIAMVFQNALSALTPVYSVGDQIAEAIRAHRGASRRAARVRAVELLDLVGIPDAARRAGALPHQFSGGMRQRVMIAMAIANDPDVIIMDEPTAALDPTVQAEILEVFRETTADTGAAIVMITHNLGLVAGFADRVMVMGAGRAVEAGDVDDVFYRPRMPYTAGLLAATPRLDAADCEVRRREGRDDRVVVLEVDGLVRHYPLVKGAVFRRRRGTVRAVDGIGLDVREGETVALVGESGCGKTTTLREILRLAAPQEGRVVVLGRDVAGLGRAERQAQRRNIQIVFQDPLAALDPRRTIGDSLAEPLTTHGMPRRDAGVRVAELLRLVGLEPAHAARFPYGLSGGQRQRVGIARALALKPRLILLDEPVSALDPSVQAGVLTLLAELKARLGLSYLFVAHDLTVVRHIADRVVVMHLGRVVEIGSVQDVYAAPGHPYTRALLSAIPLPDPTAERARRRIVLRGDPPDPANPPSGCRFRTRCPVYAALPDERRERCAERVPELREIGADHRVACHYTEAVPTR